MEVRDIKGVRRAIIVICLLILAIGGFYSIPKGKYFDDSIEELINNKKAEVIEVHKKMKIDEDSFIVKRIINAEDSTYIRYSLIRLEGGWSFPGTSIEVTDNNGKEYFNHGESSSGKLWGQEGLIRIDKIDEGAKYIIVKFNCYDRKSEVKISLLEDGETDEN